MSPPGVAPRGGAWIETGRGATNGHTVTSRPAGARGSKRERVVGRAVRLWSRPAGARGSKLAGACPNLMVTESRPAGARGSKQSGPGSCPCLPRSRPAGARGSKLLETVALLFCLTVAPRGGAWIETAAPTVRHRSASSRAPRGRVDRNRMSPMWASRTGVAPRGGAWIETDKGYTSVQKLKSRPAGARGSKLREVCNRIDLARSRPAGARGSKRFGKPSHTIRLRSRPAGARGSKLSGRDPAYGVGCRAPRGRVDRNTGASPGGRFLPGGRAPRGRVDRNPFVKYPSFMR